MKETYLNRSRQREVTSFFLRAIGAGSSDPTVAPGTGRGLVMTRTGSGTYQIGPATGEKCPSLQHVSFTSVGTVPFYPHITAYNEANNTINVSTFRQSNNAAYDLSTAEELWVRVDKANTVKP